MLVYTIQLFTLGTSDVPIKDHRFISDQPCGGIDLDDIALDEHLELFARLEVDQSLEILLGIKRLGKIRLHGLRFLIHNAEVR